MPTSAKFKADSTLYFYVVPLGTLCDGRTAAATGPGPLRHGFDAAKTTIVCSTSLKSFILAFFFIPPALVARSVLGAAVYGTSNIRWSFSKAVPPAFAGSHHVDEEQAGNAAGLVRKVLVVDDEADLADLAEALLSSRGLDVVVANSAIDALTILGQDGAIDAVFSDIMMPGMNGLQLADAVSELFPRIKIVLTSGYTLPSLLENRERRYLFTTKPYKLDTIMTLLRS